jgi:alpha-N-acetylglucosamine transferase
MASFNRIKEEKTTIDSDIKIRKNIDNFKKKFSKIKEEKLIIPNFRYYPSKININNSLFAYVTIIFGGDTYMPLVLALGNSIRMTNTKHKLICIIQDKPYIEDEKIKFKNITEEQINEINQIYDLCIGIDILKIDNKIKNLEFQYIKFYQNMLYYTTKCNVYGLTEYSKIIYLDSSSFIKKNIDFIFNKYNKSTYFHDTVYYTGDLRGLWGCLYLYIPNKYAYTKAIYLIENYSKIFKKYYFHFTYDENILYYAIEDEWEKDINKQFDTYIINKGDTIPYYDRNYNNNYCIQNFTKQKPTRFIINNYIESDFYTNNLFTFREWDKCVKKLIKKHPKFKKYYEYIKTYRYTLF